MRSVSARRRSQAIRFMAEYYRRGPRVDAPMALKRDTWSDPTAGPQMERNGAMSVARFSHLVTARGLTSALLPAPKRRLAQPRQLQTIRQRIPQAARRICLDNSVNVSLFKRLETGAVGDIMLPPVVPELITPPLRRMMKTTFAVVTLF
jgi:hypothetical protein